MDPIQFAHLSRAQSALGRAMTNTTAAENAEAFKAAAWAILKADAGGAAQALRNSNNPIVAKAAAHSTLNPEWQEGAAELARDYLASIAPFSIIDALKRYARVLPVQSHRVMIASDAVGDLAAEGAPKPVKRLSLSMGDVEPTKALGIVVLTQELANAAGPEGRQMFEAELAASVAQASNASILGVLVNSGTLSTPGTGDPLADLRAGLQMAGPSHGYVVAAPSGHVVDLATRVENRGGMGVRGGTFVPGVEIVAIDDASAITVIPASRVAIWDGGLELRSAEHASLDMRDTPESPAQTVSLWQTNCLGLLLERRWHLAQADDVVIVELGS